MFSSIFCGENKPCFSFFFKKKFLHFFSFFSFFHFSFFGRRNWKNRRKVPIVLMTIFLSENSIFGPRWTGKESLGMVHLKVTPAFFFFFCFSLFTCSSCLTTDVSSVVVAPWRCGVLTTSGGIAGIGLCRLLGESMI